MDAREKERQIYIRNKRRRKRRLRKILRLTMLSCALVIFLMAAKLGVMIYDTVSGRSIPTFSTKMAGEEVRADEVKIEGETTLERLKSMAGLDERAQTILTRYDEYPQELLDMLARNMDMLDFVLNYPEKKGNVYADTVGDVKKGTVPLLLQWDERWGYGLYGDGIIAACGCGPTALSMVAAGLTGDDSVTPYVVAQYADENGYYVPGVGSKWSLISEGCREFGIEAKELSLSETAIYEMLEAGRPIICSMRPGDFTTTGHFIVLAGVENGKIKVNDPNSRERSERLWDYQTLEYQIDNLWVFTVE